MSDLFGHLAINNYYYIQSRIRDIQTNTKYCPICCDRKCNHNVKYKKNKDIKQRLSWWSELALEATKTVNLSRNKIFPIWPDINLNLNLNNYLNYTLFPRLNISLTGIMKDNNECIMYNKGELSNVDYDIPIGSYWGYVVESQFYCIRKFHNGMWGYTKAFPNILHTDFKSDTFWAIPNGRLTHWEFYNGLRIV